MTVHDAEARLFALPRFAAAGSAAYNPGLDRIRALLAAMGDPHHAAPVVHIAGTNGKGSTASMVAAIGTAAGLRVGLHTSPHLLRVTERFRVDGAPAPDAWLAEAVERSGPLWDRIGPSFFEATTALAFGYLAERQVDLMVIEVGLGGRLDATNVVAPVACGVTTVGLDHTDVLGDTVEAIAREKGGIAKPGVPLLTTAEGAALGTLAAVAREAEAPFEDVRASCRLALRGSHIGENDPAGTGFHLETPLRRYPDVRLALAGEHQRWNATLAVRLAETAFQPHAAAVQNGLARTPALSGLRGRAEVLRRAPLVVADVAHNAEGLAAALATARSEMPPGGSLVALVGLMRDKDARAAANALQAADAVWTVGLPGERSHSADSLAAAFAEAGLEAKSVRSVAEGWARFEAEGRRENALLIAGSHVAAAESMALPPFRNGGTD